MGIDREQRRAARSRFTNHLQQNVYVGDGLIGESKF